MKFLRSIFSKNTVSFLHLSKEVLIAIVLISLPVFYPTTAVAGIFSFISGDKASAKTSEARGNSNSQTMGVLKAVVNSNPNPIAPNDHPILATENALVAEIGPAGTASEVDDSTSTEISLYAVREGDTLSGIAKMFGVSINTIVWANDINRNIALKEGQTLVILPITGIRYTIKKGDTIGGITAKYKMDKSAVDEFLEFNDISINTSLTAGDTLIIPDAEPTVASRTKPKTLPSLGSYFARPLPSYCKKTQGIHGHNGVDIGCPVGTPITAAASGIVIVSIKNDGWNGGYGNYVVISHPNGTQTLYAHTSRNVVAVGDKVAKGEKIAEVGNTGHSTGPHLHVEVRLAKNPF